MIYKIGLGVIFILLILMMLKIRLLIIKKNENIEELTLLKKELLEKEKRYMLAIDG